MPNWKGNQLGPQKTTKGNCPECGSNKTEKLVLDEKMTEEGFEDD